MGFGRAKTSPERLRRPPGTLLGLRNAPQGLPNDSQEAPKTSLGLLMSLSWPPKSALKIAWPSKTVQNVQKNASWAHLEVTLAVLSSIWELLGSIWGLPDSILGRTCRVLRVQIGPRSARMPDFCRTPAQDPAKNQCIKSEQPKRMKNF